MQTEDIAARLRVVAELFPDLPERAGIEPQAWSSFTSGQRRIDLESALKVRETTGGHKGATLDWIFYGREETLDREFFDKLRRRNGG